MNDCNHDLQVFVFNMTDRKTEFMCLKCGWSNSD